MLKCFLLVFVILSQSIAGFSSEFIEKKLDSKRYKNVRAGVVLYDLSDGKVLYSRMADELFIPASLTKLLLTGAILENISSRYRFKTQIYLDKEKFKTLYIKGAGDPNHTREQFEYLAKRLKKKKLFKLKSIVFDGSLIESDENYYGNSSRYYYALSGAFNFNYNQVKLNVDSDLKKLRVDPQTSFISLDTDSLRFLNSDKRGFPKISLYSLPNKDKFIIRGKVSKQDENYTNLNLRISRPHLFYSTLLKDVLLDHGITVENSVRFEFFSTKKKKRFITLTSAPLHDYLRVMNQDSSNMIASSLLKFLGIRATEASGSLDAGLGVIKTFLKNKLSIKPDTLQIQDGSGLSAKNQITGRQLLTYLIYFHKKHAKKMADYFVDANQSSDYESLQLKENFQERYHVYVKSGTLANLGVNNLAGYIIDKNTNDQFGFVILTQLKRYKKPAYKGTFSNPILKAMMNGLNL